MIKGSQLSERKKQYLQALDNLFASNPNGAEKVKVLTVRDCTTFTFYIGSGRTTQLWMRVDNAELEKLKQGDQTVAVRFSRVGWDSRKARPVMPFNQLPEKYQDQILEALDKQEEN